MSPDDFTKVLFCSLSYILLLPSILATDTLGAIAWLSVSFIRQVGQVRLGLQAEQQTATHALGLRCISWTLQTSVEGPVRLSALRYLETMILNNSHPTQVVAGWFDTIFDCIRITNSKTTIVQGLEELVAASSLLCLCTLSNLVATDPMPKILEDIRRRYIRTIPSKTNFHSPPVPHTLGAIHTVLHANHADDPLLPVPKRRVRWRVQWEGYEPSSDEHIKVAHALTNFARSGYKRDRGPWIAKVPRWILRFALHSLSQDPLPPVSVVVDSLSIIAIDLGCNIPDIVTINPPDQRCVRIKRVIIALT